MLEAYTPAELKKMKVYESGFMGKRNSLFDLLQILYCLKLAQGWISVLFDDEWSNDTMIQKQKNNKTLTWFLLTITLTITINNGQCYYSPVRMEVTVQFSWATIDLWLIQSAE